MLLEICVTSVESALAAQRGGAARVELCDNLAEGGTTPGYGLISVARKSLRIKLHVMIRPRGGDFLYDDTEFEIMRQDINLAGQLGADGVVFGILTADGQVDVKRMQELIHAAKPMHVTFHRSFDMTADPFHSLEQVIECGADSLLTSGHQNKASEGIPLLKKLADQAAGRIEIMAGSGVNAENVSELVRETGVDAVHLTAKKRTMSKMTFRKQNTFMGHGEHPEYEWIVADENQVRQVKSALDALY